MNQQQMLRVLFICMGNICRSPTAHGIFRHKLAESGLDTAIDVDSAGTHGFHVGGPPDRRAVAILAEQGIDISDLRSRQVTLSDFASFDYIVAMDEDNYEHLRALSPESAVERIHRLMDFAPDFGDGEVPDPYYGGSSGFERVCDLVEAGTEGFLAHLKVRHGLG